MLHIFIIFGTIAELLVTLVVFALYYIISLFDINFDALYLSATSFIFLIITIIGIFLSARLGKKILKPVMSIKNATKAVTEGDYKTQLPETSGIAEISEITHSFNMMVRELGNTEMLREDFIANVSHEFKTPLTAIEGYATLMQGQITEEEKAEYIQSILYNTRRLSSLTGSILMLSRLQNQEIMGQKEKFRLDEQICNVMVEFESAWEEKELEVNLELEEVTCYGYKELLPHLWSNLIQNAIKFSREGGELKITCRYVREGIAVQVIDNGIGMDEEVKKHIYDKFYQADASHGTEGNGLGLALVKGILELSKGSIDVESSPGKGSCFTVVLPDA